jgi:hypothetical protein
MFECAWEYEGLEIPWCQIKDLCSFSALGYHENWTQRTMSLR